MDQDKANSRPYRTPTEGLSAGARVGGQGSREYRRPPQLGSARLLPSGTLPAATSTGQSRCLCLIEAGSAKRLGKLQAPKGCGGELPGEDGKTRSSRPPSPLAPRGQRKQRLMRSAPEASFSINPRTCSIRCRSQRRACGKLPQCAVSENASSSIIRSCFPAM